MNMDFGNREMLAAGAFYSLAPSSSEWQPILTAPHDGTVIEVRCTYGVAPWFGLYRWMETPNTCWCYPNGPCTKKDGRWAKVGDENCSFEDGPSFSWRPYVGNASAYIDPTGGAQDSAAYWRGAVAVKHGLPLDYFERHGKLSNTEPLTAPPPQAAPPLACDSRSWWRRLFGHN